MAEPSEGEGTGFQAQRRREGHFLTVISGYLLGGPYVPILSPSCPHPCLLLAKRNSGLGIHDLCFSSQLLQLFDEGWRKEEDIMSFAGKNGILLLLVPTQGTAEHGRQLSRCPGTSSQGHSLQVHVDWKGIFSKCHFQAARLKESWLNSGSVKIKI